METVTISTFKATCLALIDRVNRTGEPIRITRRGEPVAEIVPVAAEGERDWLGSMRQTGKITGDLVAPVVDERDWEALR